MQTKTFLRAVIAAIAVMVMAFSPAAAVTDGYEDGSGHPYVGIMVAQSADGTPLWRCSGTLISPTIFLTAGHCTYGAARATIWFDPYLEYNAESTYPTGGEVDGTAYTHWSYNDSAFYLYDLGIVVLDEPVTAYGFASLPELNQLDALGTQRGRQDVTFTVVGYGLQTSFPEAAAWKENNVKVRMVSHPRLIQINTGLTGDGSLILSNNANTGGTCFGDSGGPNFIGTSNVIAGVTSFGMNGNCAGTGGVYRIDRADDLDWIYTEFGDLL